MFEREAVYVGFGMHDMAC